MSNSFNCVGWIAFDPILKEAGSTTLLNFVVNNKVGFGTKAQTNQIRCVIFGKRAVSLAGILKKSQQVFISGELSTREYNGKTSLELNCQAVDIVGNTSQTRVEEPVKKPVRDLDDDKSWFSEDDPFEIDDNPVGNDDPVDDYVDDVPF